MTKKNNSPENEFNELLDLACENMLQPDQLKRFEELLLSDPDACSRYVETVSLQVDLEWGEHFGFTFPGEVNNLKLDQLLLEETSQVDQADEKVVLSTHRSTLGFLSDGASQVRDFFMKTPILSITISFSVLVCFIVAMAMINIQPDQPDSKDIDYSNIEVARIIDSANIKWASPEDKVTLQNKLMGGQKLNLVSGVMEIQFIDGATVILEGPVEFELTTPGAGKLYLGKLFAFVPGRAIGFTVETPAAKVVDLGTRFGVEVEKDGNELLHVTKGKVRLDLVAQNGEARSEVIVESGNYVNYGNNVKISINKATKPIRFVRSVPTDSVNENEPSGRRIAIADPSFEETKLADGANISPSSAWRSRPEGFGAVFDPRNDQFPGTTGDGVNALGKLADGGQVGLIQNSKNHPHTALSQELAEDVVAGGKYALQFWVGTRADAFKGMIRPSGKFRVQILAGKKLILDKETQVDGPYGSGKIRTVQCTAPVDASGKITIRFVSTDINSSQTFIDDVRLYFQGESKKK